MADVIYVLVATLAFFVPAALVARNEGRPAAAARVGGER